MEPFRMAVTGEGATDYRRRAYNAKNGRYEWREGPIFPIIRHVAKEAGCEVELEEAEKEDVFRMRLQRGLAKLGKLEGKAKDSARFSKYLAMHNYTYGIFYCDIDKEAGGKNTEETVCRKLFERVYSEVKTGLEATEAEEQRVIPMLPLKMIECWLLSDSAAFQTCFGIEEPDLPAWPELIWGRKEDPCSNYPKNVLSRVLEQSEEETESSQDTYWKLANEISIDRLRKKCSISFERFYCDFQKVAEEQNAAGKDV